MRLLLALLLAIGSPAAFADLHGSDKARKLVSEGHALVAQRKYNEAMERYEAARQDSPGASSPLSAAAFNLYNLAAGSNDPAARAQVEKALALARHALTLAPEDPLASEVLRISEDSAARPPYRPIPAAAEMYWAGEALFHRAQYQEASQKYREAYRLDPKFITAIVMEGDCYFMEQNWVEAERLFRSAAQADPLNAQAWRFLADTYLKMGATARAEQAVLQAVAALPSQKTSWERFNWLENGGGKKLERLELQRKAWAVMKPDGKGVDLSVTEEFKGKSLDNDADFAAWGYYAISHAVEPKLSESETDLQAEVRHWTTAFSQSKKLEAEGKPPLRSPDLVVLRRLFDAGQLETGIMLLMFREAYRPQFEAWKKAQPDGIREFVKTWQVMP